MQQTTDHCHKRGQIQMQQAIDHCRTQFSAFESDPGQHLSLIPIICKRNCGTENLLNGKVIAIRLYFLCRFAPDVLRSTL